MTIFTIIIIFVSYELCYLGPTMILPSPWHLFMTHNYWIIFSGQNYLLSYLPSHCCIWRVWSVCQVLRLWLEPNMVHIRLPFIQPGLCDVQRCPLLFVGALAELQHFIWSLEWIEWGKFRCKAARVFIFGPTILSCIKRDRVRYKSISPSGD